MPTSEPKIIRDFNKIALLPEVNWNHNKHYHGFIERRLPKNCKHLLEIGCGKGELCRQLSKRVDHILGVDIADQMIEIAEERTTLGMGITFKKVNYMDKALEENHYDCIVSVATVHHMDFEQFAARVKKELKPGGKLLVVDLYQEETLLEALLDYIAMPVSGFYKIVKNKRIKSSPTEQQVWQEHGESDEYLTIEALHDLAKKHFPGAKLKRRLLWRYTLEWVR